MLFLFVCFFQSSTKKALSLCASLTGRSNGPDVGVMSKVFQASCSASALKKFDPSKQCVASAAQSKKKKACRAKPSKLNVILLKEYPFWIPKKHEKKKIDADKRIQQIKVTREMTWSEIRMEIQQQFKSFSLDDYAVYLSSPSGRLLKAIKSISLRYLFGRGCVQASSSSIHLFSSN